MATDSFTRLAALAGLFALATFIAALLQWTGGGRRSFIPVTAWSILGGTLAGLLLGPIILGRVLPTEYEQWYVGGAIERIERDRLISRHGAELFAAEHALLDVGERDLLRKRHVQELAESTSRWREAKWEDQQSQRWAALVIIAMVLLAGGMRVVRNSSDLRQGWLSPISIGLGAAIIPAGLAFAAFTSWWDVPRAPALLAATALGIGPWALTAVDRRTADEAEFGGAHMIQTAGRIGSTLALIAAIAAMTLSAGLQGAIPSAVLLALPLGWLFAGRWHVPAAVERAIDCVLISALAAIVAVKIEWIEHFSFWPLVLILLLSDDVRWAGAFIGAMLPGGRRALRTTRLVMGLMSAGVTQLSIAALAIHTDGVPDFIVPALLAGALLMEFTAPMRRNLVEQINRAEAELDDDHG